MSNTRYGLSTRAGGQVGNPLFVAVWGGFFAQKAEIVNLNDVVVRYSMQIEQNNVIGMFGANLLSR